MKGDFSRDTFNIAKRYSRVLEQQGRVQLDADANEQSAILLHYLRTLGADLLGPFAGPEGNSGFEIGTPKDGDFAIGAGRYYVDGILCENFDDLTYKTQKDYPKPPALGGDGGCLFYLDVWERHISALEDDSIRETALGGPDTTTRAKVVWQVKVEPVTDAPSPEAIREEWEVDWEHRWQPPERGRLKADLEHPEDSGDPCLTAPDAKYRGQENQLYRVEIHRGGKIEDGDQQPTFKWSRDNGAVATRVKKHSDKEVLVSSARGFTPGHWVELTSDEQELRGEPGMLVRLVKVEDDRFTLGESAQATVPEGEAWPTKARRWDSPAVPIKEDMGAGWIALENGIQVQFQPTGTDDQNFYRTGDYWLIPARVATGNIEWPRRADGEPAAMKPSGVEHHYAPLAILSGGANAKPKDCRREFKGLGKPK